MKKLFSDNIFLLVIFCIPLYLIKVKIFGVPTNILELLALSAIIPTVIQEKKLLLDKSHSLPKILAVSLLLIIFGLLTSTFFNNNHTAGLGIIKGWFIIPLLFSFALYSKINSEIAIEKIYGSLYLSTVTVGIIAIAYKIIGITTYDNRLNAFYLSPNHLAMYLAPGIFFGLYFLQKELSQKYDFNRTALHIILLATIAIPIYYAYSYGAWIAISASLTIIIAANVPSNKNILKYFLLFSLFVAALFISQIGTEKFSTLKSVSERSSIASRQIIWRASLQLIAENPWMGIGPGNFQSSYLSIQSEFPLYLEWAVPQPHNIFLAFWLQAGLIGIIGFLMLLFFIFRKLWLLTKDKKNAALAAPLFGFFLYTVLHGLVDTTYWKNDLAFLFWICIFLTLSIHKKQLDNSSSTTS